MKAFAMRGPSGKQKERKKKKERENKLPIFYKRCVDDTLGAMLDPEAAMLILSTLQAEVPSISLTFLGKSKGSLLAEDKF